MRRNLFAFEEAEVLEQPEQLQQVEKVEQPVTEVKTEQVVNSPAEQPTEEAPIVMQDLSEDLVCIDEDEEELGDYVDSIEDTFCDADELQGYSDIMEKNLDNGMSPDAVEAIQLATESICKRLGIVKKNPKISLEAFEELKNNKESTRLAFEENNGVIVRTLKAIWVAIKKAIVKIKEFIKKLFGFNKKIESKADDIYKEAERHEKQDHKPSPIVEPHTSAESVSAAEKQNIINEKFAPPKYIGDSYEKNDKGSFVNKTNTTVMLKLAKILNINSKTANARDIKKAFATISGTTTKALETCTEITEEAISNITKYVETGKESTDTVSTGGRMELFFGTYVMPFSVKESIVRKQFKVYSDNVNSIDSFLVEICPLDQAKELMNLGKDIIKEQIGDERNISEMTDKIEKAIADAEKALDKFPEEKAKQMGLVLKKAAMEQQELLKELSKVLSNFYKGIHGLLDYAEKSLSYYA